MKPLDPLLIGMIQQVAEDKASKGELFTAFDVSRAVQNMGHRERHNNMKHVVHELWEAGRQAGTAPWANYDRTLVTVEQGKPDAWVYHPIGTDSTAYQPTYQPLPSSMTPQSFYQQGVTGSGSPAPATPSQTPSLSSISFNPSTRLAKDSKHRPDKRGAVSVPAKLIKQIGAKPGDKLDVDKDGTTLVISTTGNGGRKYTVNDSLNIRIKRKTWGQIASGGDFAFEEHQGKIVMKVG